MDFSAFGITEENIDRCLLLDTETTGFGKDDEIIEIGAVNLKGKVIVSQRFLPEKEVSPGAMKVNHLSKKVLAKEPSFEEMWPTIWPLLEGKILVTHNGSFDKRLLSQTLIKYNLLDCSEELFTDFIDICKFFSSIPGRSGNSLNDLAHEFKIFTESENEKHAAVDDCKLLGNVMYKSNEYIKANFKPDTSSDPKPKRSSYVEIPKKIAIFGYIIEGLSIPEIAEKVELAPSTVENYMLDAYKTGFLDSTKFFTYDEYMEVKEARKKLKDEYTLKDIKEAVSENITYLKLKIILYEQEKLKERYN